MPTPMPMPMPMPVPVPNANANVSVNPQQRTNRDDEALVKTAVQCIDIGTVGVVRPGTTVSNQSFNRKVYGMSNCQ